MLLKVFLIWIYKENLRTLQIFFSHQIHLGKLRSAAHAEGESQFTTFLTHY